MNAMSSFLQRFVIVFTGLLVLSGAAHPQSKRELYELQDRCGKRAAEVFAKEHGDGFYSAPNGDKFFDSYRNHYNFDLNKCFYLVLTRIVMKEGGEIRTLELFDLNENNRFGLYIGEAGGKIPKSCEMRDKACHSENEWLSLANPFIDE